MLKKFSLKNYKNFKEEVCIDFGDVAGYQFSEDCITDGMIGKMLIYGRNATGKTNLGRAIMDIGFTLFGEVSHNDYEVFLNADSTEEAAVFSYVFQFGDQELIYKYARFSGQRLRDEELIIDGETIFKMDFVSSKCNFENLKYLKAETANIERYLQSMEIGAGMEEETDVKLPFLRWLINNVALEQNSILIQLGKYVLGMRMITVKSAVVFRRSTVNDFSKSLESEERLHDLEDFLNAMGVDCRLKVKKLPDGQYKLYFAHEKLVSFYENASSGTLALIDLYQKIVSRAKEAAFLYLDEFDAFYHYEMAEKLVQFLKKKYPGCQMVMTSHNTNLISNRLMRPDCVFILSRKGTLTALCNATPRELREGHNLEKMYISGEFEKYE